MFAGTINLVGCGNTSGHKLSYISCEIDNSHYDSESNKFVYVWESNLLIDVQKSDFIVTAHYSDNTTEVVTDFEMDIYPIIRPPFENKDYHSTIKISYKNKTNQYSLDIQKRDFDDVKTFINDNLHDIEVEYTGDVIDIVSQFDGLKDLIDEGRIVINQDIGTRRATELGKYFFKVNSEDKKIEKTITWTIIEGRISLPLVNHTPFKYNEDTGEIYVELNIEYDGIEHGLSFDFAEGTEHLITVYDSETGLEGYSTTHSETGEYLYLIRTNNNYAFKSIYFDYHEIHTEAFICMKINKKPLALSGESALMVTSPIYKGSAYTFNDLTTNIPTDLFEIAYFPPDCTEVGNYEIIIMPKLSTVLNYTWADGSEILSHNMHIYFKVLSAD